MMHLVAVMQQHTEREGQGPANRRSADRTMGGALTWGKGTYRTNKRKLYQLM